MPLNILALEPWYAGSHKDFLDGLVSHSSHHIIPHTLPGRFWKWRQTGSGMILAERALADERLRDTPPDLIFASDFLNLPDFLALTRQRWPNVPSVLYFHENQLAYPLQAEHKLDLAYAQANLSGAAVADAVWFNSPFHQEAFFDGLNLLLSACPDFAPKALVRAVRDKSQVMPLGVDLAGLQAAATPNKSGPLAILWNHRWEHDKNPQEVFDALYALSDAGYAFDLIVAGQRFSRAPTVFAEAEQRLSRHISHFGYLQDRAAYAELLARADVVVSLAHHDFFGVSVVEAMAMGCLPLLADRLNYRHLVPKHHHHECLVADGPELLAKLSTLCATPQLARAKVKTDPSPNHPANNLVDRPPNWVAPFDWPVMAQGFDTGFCQIGPT